LIQRLVRNNPAPGITPFQIGCDKLMKIGLDFLIVQGRVHDGHIP